MRVQCLLCVSLSMVLGVAVAGPPNPPPLYRIQKLEGLQGAPFAINDRGDITGYGIFDSEAPDGPSAPYLWTKKRLVRLDPTGSYRLDTASAINDRRQIAGIRLALDSSGQLQSMGYVWERGRIRDIGDLPGGMEISHATDINRRGQVVGRGDSEQRTECVLWEDGNLMALGGAPANFLDCMANAINDFGVVVGTGGSADGRYPFVWQDGVMTLLSVPSGGTFGSAGDINNLGMILGFYALEGSAHNSLWFGEHQLTLPLPPGFVRGGPTKLNDRGQMVGSVSRQDSFDSVAFLWHYLWPVDLNTRIAPNDPLKDCVLLRYGQAINNAGEIAAMGADNCAGENSTVFRLVPVKRGK